MHNTLLIYFFLNQEQHPENILVVITTELIVPVHRTGQIHVPAITGAIAIACPAAIYVPAPMAAPWAVANIPPASGPSGVNPAIDNTNGDLNDTPNHKIVLKIAVI